MGIQMALKIVKTKRRFELFFRREQKYVEN